MKTFIISLLLALTLTSPSYAQEPLRDESEPAGSTCANEDEPLSPNSREARRLKNSDDLDDQACAELRIELYRQESGEAEVAEEALLDSRVMQLQRTVLQLLQQLHQLLLLRL